jgi:hypothetical protein
VELAGIGSCSLAGWECFAYHALAEFVSGERDLRLGKCAKEVGLSFTEQRISCDRKNRELRTQSSFAERVPGE